MRTVLVIDDNPAVAQALALLFGLHDIRTLAAATPSRAWRCWRASAPIWSSPT
jgi:CheY-like chemotaxis protein